MLSKNILLNTDSYKLSQFNQYPPGTETVYSYIESRGSKQYDSLVFLGLQAFLMEYLSTPITREMIEEAEHIARLHGMPFNLEGWQYILDVHGGHLPVEIKSVDEGTVMPLSNVLVSIENTDPKCWWLTSYLETALLRAIWYPTTVATNSYLSKQIITQHLEKSGTPELIDFKLHDFGARGVSSLESAGLAAMAHLVNFKGTDTLTGILYAMEYYGADVCGFSIPAMEHSTVTSWGRDGESKSFKNMLSNYGGQGKTIACVSDSYNVFDACGSIWGEELKEYIIQSGTTVVIRPDSGDPVDVIIKCLRILDSKFGHTLVKGYRLLNHVRLIQGDGIDHQMINAILTVMELNGYSADNIAFGQGGALLQGNTRDDLKFAMKCSAIYANGEWIDVFKDPITDSGKRSKKGRLMLIKNSGSYETVRLEEGYHLEDQLKTRYLNGQLKNTTTFDEIRQRASAV